MAGPRGFAGTFGRDGCLSVDRLFDPALIDSAREEFERQFPNLSKEQLPQHLKVGHRRVQLPIEVKGAIADPMLSAHPLVLGIIESLLGKDPVIDSLSCVVALPGAKAQHLHRDHASLFGGAKEVERTIPPYAVTVAIPLVDLTEETGSTLLLKGSQEVVTGSGPNPGKEPTAYRAFVARGGCYLMDYRLWHQGMANGSEQPRPILYIVYARSWFTDGSPNFGQHERVRVTREVLLAMPIVQRRLFRRLAAKGAHDMTEAQLLAD